MPQRTGETVREPGRKPPRCGITHLFVGTRAEEEGSIKSQSGPPRGDGLQKVPKVTGYRKYSDACCAPFHAAYQTS